LNSAQNRARLMVMTYGGLVWHFGDPTESQIGVKLSVSSEARF